MKSTDQLKAFNVLFEEILDVQMDDRVILLFDESFQPFLEAFTAMADKKGINTLNLFLPKSHQENVVKNSKSGTVTLPERLGQLIRESDVVFNILNGSLTTQSFRKAILSHNIGRKTSKLAHIPGLTEKILRLITITPFQKVVKHCELLAWVLGQSEEIKVETFDIKGNSYELIITKNKWDDLTPPQISSGIISKGSWGNVPPGESFICPEPDGVSGSICINGSIHGMTLKRQDEFVLNFEKGILKDEIRTSSERIQSHFKTQKKMATRYGDPNWNHFAELGIGTNPAIRKLTGNMLFDEKMANTIHIAIGDSSVFGGNISSKTHEDMVIKGANITFNSKRIIRKGIVNYSAISKWKGVNSSNSGFELKSSFVKNIKHSNVKFINGTIYKCIEMNNRETCVPICVGEIANAVNLIWSKLSSLSVYTVDELRQFLNGRISIEFVVNFMMNYGLLTIEDEES